jgi:nucleotide-binding universal stress UspA family protein
MPFADITVPVDGSETAQRGIDYAIGLARRGGSVLHFCSVVDELIFDAEGACREAITAARERGIAADGKVVYGSVVPSIHQYAAETRSTALVLGSNARSGLARVVFGSVAEHLIAGSNVPVIAVHADDQRHDNGPITVAIDDSDAARAALALSIELACAWNEGLAIVHVAHEGRAPWHGAAELLDNAADAVRMAGVDFELVTALGHTAEQVVDGAERRRSSMIVVGTDVRSPIARLILGSVAGGVLERARLPVTVVPHHAVSAPSAGRTAALG